MRRTHDVEGRMFERSRYSRVLASLAMVTGLVVGMVGLMGYALAEDFKVGQAGQKFSEKKISVKVGDTIHFVNDDDVVHQVTIQEMGLDSGAMDPGAKFRAEMTEAGEFKARCSIHPRMRMKVTVE